MTHNPVVLTISGSDSGGGAGLQADLKTFAAFGTFGTSAIVALTAQNTRGVRGVRLVEPEFVRDQLRAIFEDLPVAAAKTGMLATSELMEVVIEEFAARPEVPLVIDPVAVARSGDPLLEPSAVTTLRDRLLPLAAVATPNRLELALLTGLPPIEDAKALREGARELFKRCGRPILAKGGAILPEALDVLVTAEREFEFTAEDAPIATTSTHGTGCTLSAAIAAGLALGRALPEAIREAKAYVTGAIRHAPGLGGGHGPIGHGWRDAKKAGVTVGG